MSKEQEEVKTEGTFKIKKKPGRPKKLSNQNKDNIKIDLSKLEEQKEEQKIDKVVIPKEEVENNNIEEIKEEVKEEKVIEKTEETPIVEVIEEKDTSIKPLVEKEPLPENIEKLVNFMKDTGGTMEDYIRLNADYSQVNSDQLLREYYNKSKPHLDAEEINFLLEDQFSYDEEIEEDRQVRKKKLAYKEEIAKAKTFLEDLKSKYYEEIKLRPGATQDQQKAVEFFNEHNKEQEIAQERHNKFTMNTKNFFGEDFKGFDFNVSDKKFRYNVNNKESLADKQSNLNNFVEKFFDKDGDLKNYSDYHKAIYAAENADTIAQHFYEQGKADAVKDVMAKSKNIDNSPRATSTGDVFVNGLKVKAIDGVDSSKLKLRINKNK
tara:strand:+ start:1070 stop:2203 length:1134 start_codon:yes stop_codon:yes gene_type:complete